MGPNLYFFKLLIGVTHKLMALGIKYFKIKYLNNLPLARKPFFSLILRVLLFISLCPLPSFPYYEKENHLACVVNRSV